MSLRAWFGEAVEPSLLMSFLLVTLGTAIASRDGVFNLEYYVLSIIGVTLAQNAVNVLNDYHDYKTGVDAKTVKTPFSGGSKFLVSGLIRPENAFSFGLASLLLNSPQNPTGAVSDRKEIEKLATLAEKHDLLVVTDEIYEKLIYDATHVSIASLPGMLERTVTINGFSKSYAMTGWRIGYCVARKSILDEIVKIHAYSLTSANSMAQKAAIAALEGPQRGVVKMVGDFKKRRDYLVKRLRTIDGVNCPTPQGAFYAFPDLSNFGRRSFELADYLLKEAKIITVPSVEYGPSRDSYLRLSFATSMEKLETGLDRMEDALDRLD